jgi:hypothetical protein
MLPRVQSGVTGHLLHPLFVRVLGDTADSDLAAVQVEEEQYISSYQPAPGQHLNRKEVGSRQHCPVTMDEVGPGGGPTPFRRRSDAMPQQNVAHVWSDTRCPKLPRAPTIRSYPHPEFSRASRTTSSSISGLMRGRPMSRRCFEPSNLCAMSPAIPGGDGVGPGHTSDLLQRLPAESLTDLGQRGPSLRRLVVGPVYNEIGRQAYPSIISHPEISS